MSSDCSTSSMDYFKSCFMGGLFGTAMFVGTGGLGAIAASGASSVAGTSVTGSMVAGGIISAVGDGFIGVANAR